MATAAVPITRLLTAEEFAELPDDGVKKELIRGCPSRSIPPFLAAAKFAQTLTIFFADFSKIIQSAGWSATIPVSSLPLDRTAFAEQMSLSIVSNESPPVHCRGEVICPFYPRCCSRCGRLRTAGRKFTRRSLNT
jgi:hypothetical protein